MSIPNLDKTDRAILNLLQADGSMTYKEIAGKVGKSMTSVVERIRFLKCNHYIKRTVALIDIEKVRPLMVAFPHIQLKEHSQENILDFKKRMSTYAEVMECFHLTGHFDFMIKIVLPDMVGYNEFMTTNIASLPYVGAIQSFLVLSETKHETAYLL
ncbi:Lrp/AsnC family transcriptional regulator [Pedobacter jeongneungensis]|uniref:Lrp/AsnC family transcriptional regulator n=1 Tax=Pedobacter jeongneungensis TaxID=947309 RepID=UPI00046864FF|nr:Lrp/AsnC family transcriptional regulator [Pedobacter jeongneungensis]